jgi:hypothetical protein
MEYNNNSNVKPRSIKKAVVLLDNTKETGSTGGRVIDVFDFFYDFTQPPYDPNKYPYPYDTNNKRLISVNCPENCKQGWIYTDKTNILVDPNK